MNDLVMLVLEEECELRYMILYPIPYTLYPIPYTLYPNHQHGLFAFYSVYSVQASIVHGTFLHRLQNLPETFQKPSVRDDSHAHARGLPMTY